MKHFAITNLQLKMPVCRFFQQDEFGNVVPKNTHEYYDYTLPTGLEVKKSEFKLISNVQVAGERYKDEDCNKNKKVIVLINDDLFVFQTP